MESSCEWMSVSRRQRSASLDSNEKNDSAQIGRTRAQSTGCEDESSLSILSAMTSPRGKNYRRRRRQQSTKKSLQDNKEECTHEKNERDLIVKQLKRTNKLIRGIEELAQQHKESLQLAIEQKSKLERRESLEANRVALEAKLAELDRERERNDQIAAALDQIEFDLDFECRICFEVLETPTQIIRCGHVYCRFCVEAIIRKAQRPCDCVCPLCRTSLYDGRTRTAALQPAVKMRRKLKKVTGTCHCGSIMSLSLLRDHLRQCGEPAKLFTPRPKFAHEYLKPNFFTKHSIKNTLPSTRIVDSEQVAAAMIRRFESVSRAETSSRQVSSVQMFPPAEEKVQDVVENEETSLLTNSIPASSTGLSTDQAIVDTSDEEETKLPHTIGWCIPNAELTTTPVKISLQEIIQQEERKTSSTSNKHKSKTSTPVAWPVQESRLVPLAAFMTSPAQNNTQNDQPALPAPRNLASSWRGLDQPKEKPSVLAILAERGQQEKRPR